MGQSVIENCQPAGEMRISYFMSVVNIGDFLFLEICVGNTIERS